jgi:plastocyanin
MEKVGSVRNKILFLLGIFILALAFSAAMPDASAGTVMAQPEPPPERLGPGESYPESRFGHGPSKVDTGVSPGYASRAVEELESSDEADSVTAAHAASRSPAGLEFTTSPNRAAGRNPAPPVISQSAFSDTSSPAVTPNTAVARKGIQEVALIASDLGYFPRTVFVSRDVPVRLYVTGSSKNTLCIMMDSFSVRKQVRSHKIEEITFTPNVPGKYRFYCPVNGMEGMLVVKEFASTSLGGSGIGGDDSVSSQSSAPARQPASSSEGGESH